MRPLVSRRITTSVLCAAALLGIAGPAYAAADDSPRNPATDTPSSPADVTLAPVPGLAPLPFPIKTPEFPRGPASVPPVFGLPADTAAPVASEPGLSTLPAPLPDRRI
ncbi:hypothetical protein GCM10020367_28300 [Streptomyces sannanensis]|uniref:Uncharacterized protein n=1 Tax=Streptomyces sannanensis TaxID=285536 RepID=A0ABP6SBR0_9ACTN